MVKLSELLSKLSEFARIKYDHSKRISDIKKQISDSVTRLRLVEREVDKKISKNKLIQNSWEATQQQIDTVIRNSKSTHPWLAQAFADVIYLRDDKISILLEAKRNPAPMASAAVKAIAREKRELLRDLKECRYKINYYEALFPTLGTYVDEDEYEYEDAINIDDSDKDEVLLYVTKDEYNKLSTTERNQLALDRYKNRRHSKSHIGKMYERYIGYLYETNGYQVEYFGIKKKLEDLGRDLICSKDIGIHVVQCKNWSRFKVIHENAICQLYGTATKLKIEYRRKNNDLFSGNVTPVFFTTTQLSDTAVEFAKELGVKYIVEPMSFEYPMIKCNVGSYGEKIYHLPFDPQYDNTLIKKKDEFYAKTVAEAEQAGFRRAKIWRSTNVNHPSEI